MIPLSPIVTVILTAIAISALLSLLVAVTSKPSKGDY